MARDADQPESDQEPQSGGRTAPVEEPSFVATNVSAELEQVAGASTGGRAAEPPPAIQASTSGRSERHASEAAALAQLEEAMAAAASGAPPGDVVATLPRYAAPSIASTLPSYRNGEQEFIYRTFAVGNYDMLRHLPASVREQQVQAARSQRQEAARTFLMPGLLGTQMRLKSNPENAQGLFSTFEYIPSRYSLAQELASKERVAAEATRLVIGKGQEFKPSVAVKQLKHEDLDPGRGFIYLSGPEEDTEDLKASHRSHHEEAYVNPPFVPPGTGKVVGEPPTRAAAVHMMKRLKRVLEADWDGSMISIFENEQDCWVVCFQLATVDSPEGLAAYMNVFVRTNPVATEFRLAKVIEFWGAMPGDGCAYYVLRPPWVVPDRLETFFKLHPEERDYRTSLPVMEMQKTRERQQRALDASLDAHHLSQMAQLSIAAAGAVAGREGLGSAAATSRSVALKGALAASAANAKLER
ncbi:hypothetical protein HYH03_003615 [Edaphochlamys debaryana]|uniref:Uncharacterized protein n=1 Tax=Edaphochlamys debaryana TaxID=47281 RepID=A0A836C2T4_9CHLO|nr:hypothetical protein HYH03_003615 [Edaphochlamys debaryana]|eukprot:KAG2498356.1 hypothetical protein HYH03_003615 [Edaphochlamys debaryana]